MTVDAAKRSLIAPRIPTYSFHRRSVAMGMALTGPINGDSVLNGGKRACDKILQKLPFVLLPFARDKYLRVLRNRNTYSRQIDSPNDKGWTGLDGHGWRMELVKHRGQGSFCRTRKYELWRRHSQRDFYEIFDSRGLLHFYDGNLYYWLMPLATEKLIRCCLAFCFRDLQGNNISVIFKTDFEDMATLHVLWVDFVKQWRKLFWPLLE